MKTNEPSCGCGLHKRTEWLHEIRHKWWFRLCWNLNCSHQFYFYFYFYLEIMYEKLVLNIPSVASKRGHETKKHALLRYQTWRVLSPNIWSLTAVKQTVAPDQRVPLISLFHFSQLAGIFLAQKQHTCLQKVFLTSKNACKEYFVEQKQIKSTTSAYSQLRMFGAKTCRVCTQLEHVFPFRVHA